MARKHNSRMTSFYSHHITPRIKDLIATCGDVNGGTLAGMAGRAYDTTDLLVFVVCLAFILFSIEGTIDVNATSLNTGLSSDEKIIPEGEDYKIDSLFVALLGNGDAIVTLVPLLKILTIFKHTVPQLSANGAAPKGEIDNVLYFPFSAACIFTVRV